MIATKRFALLVILMIVAALVQRPGAARMAGAATLQLTAITARPLTGGASLVLETSEPTGFAASRPNPLTILIDLRNVDAANAGGAVGAGVDAAGVIAAVAVEPAEALGVPMARVRVTLAQPLTYQVRSERNTIVLDVRPGVPAVKPPPSTNPAIRLVPSPGLPKLAAQAAQAAGAGQRAYTGNPISLDFQGADLRAVLRMFSEISGLNIVIDPAIQGTVDVMLTDVPWDQALEIILQSNKLGYQLEGTIARIAPLSVLADEETQKRKLADEQALAGELRVLTKTLSYARAEDLQQLITRSTLSARGTVQVDPRTNTLILTDLQDRLNTAESLLNALDTAQPQVEIEARIVQTSKDFARELGIQWGFAGRVDPALGNTTNLAFPNSGTLIGTVVNTDAPVPPGTAVGLGVSGATSAVGLALGSINGAFNLDVALSALETSGNGKILSTPRVSTQNNVEAEITQGVQVPIQTVANNTVTTTFKDAALTLKVTPQITAAGTVIMKIVVENSSVDFARAVGLSQIPPINTQRANTTVLVMDGQTTVIGGIYTSQEQKTSSRTPGLSQVPFLKWLFKHDGVRDQSTELMIFITPRITQA